VLGPGCANCHKLESITWKVVTEMALEADVQKITSYADIMQYPVLGTPALVVNEQVVCSGRVPSEAEVTTWLVDALAAS
jgi:small redox-active disulfide protein 2